jgi:hypothetical protein
MVVLDARTIWMRQWVHDASTDSDRPMSARGGDQPTGALEQPHLERLSAAIDAYDEQGGKVYDEVFVEVQKRIAASGCAGKLDIAAITVWKRSAQGSRWIGRLMSESEGRVREVTRAAFAAKGDGAALNALAVLPGYESQGPLATALLSAYRPADFGVMDRRARAGLKSLDRGVGTSKGMTLRYFKKVRELRDDLAALRPGVTARDIDKGLYVLGAPAR